MPVRGRSCCSPFYSPSIAVERASSSTLPSAWESRRRIASWRVGRGWGATEAIRGALCHWIELKDGKIKNYQIVAPTTWNVGPRDANSHLGPIEQALIGAPIADPRDPVEVGHVARSFDSCLVCTVHAHDGKTGKELARFRVG